MDQESSSSPPPPPRLSQEPTVTDRFIDRKRRQTRKREIEREGERNKIYFYIEQTAARIFVNFPQIYLAERLLPKKIPLSDTCGIDSFIARFAYIRELISSGTDRPVGERSVTSVVGKGSCFSLYFFTALHWCYYRECMPRDFSSPRWSVRDPSSPLAGSALTCDELQTHGRHTRCFIIAPKPSLYSALPSCRLAWDAFR